MIVNRIAKIRNSCPHLCKLKCHFNKVGKSSNCDVVTCTSEVTVRCECGRLEKKSNVVQVLASLRVLELFLECDSVCVAAKRDAALRAAFMGTPEPETTATEGSLYNALIIQDLFSG